jgi:hypothetical protein
VGAVAVKGMGGSGPPCCAVTPHIVLFLIVAVPLPFLRFIRSCGGGRAGSALGRIVKDSDGWGVLATLGVLWWWCVVWSFWGGLLGVFNYFFLFLFFSV